MHPKSPQVSASDGAVTLLYKMGKEDWLQRFLDVEGTEVFQLVMQGSGQDLHIGRNRTEVEVRFFRISTRGYPVDFGNPQISFLTSDYIPATGVRYRISPTGEWSPVSAADYDDQWGGSLSLVRTRGEAVAKAIWYHQRWSGDNVSVIGWTGITEAETADNWAWVATFKQAAEARKDEEKERSRLNPAGEMDFLTMIPKLLAEKRKVCRGGCGEKNGKLVCSRCKITRACHNIHDVSQSNVEC